MERQVDENTDNAGGPQTDNDYNNLNGVNRNATKSGGLTMMTWVPPVHVGSVCTRQTLFPTLDSLVMLFSVSALCTLQNN